MVHFPTWRKLRGAVANPDGQRTRRQVRPRPTPGRWVQPGAGIILPLEGAPPVGAALPKGAGPENSPFETWLGDYAFGIEGGGGLLYNEIILS
jgi:hypothetical protein